MDKPSAVEQLREAIVRDSRRPPRERYQSMIDRGVIDEKGRVLLRRPEPSSGQAKVKKGK